MPAPKKRTVNGKTFYEVRYDAGYDGQGKRIQKYKRFSRRKDAEAFLSDQLSHLNKGTYVEPQKKFLYEYLKEWLEEKKEVLSPTSYNGYETNVRCHINPYIGGIRLQDLKPFHIRKTYSKLQKNREVKIEGEKDKRAFKSLSGTSVLYVHRVLSKALEDAYKDEIIHKNPARLVTPPEKKKFEGASLPAAQIKEMLDKFQDDEMFMPVMLSVLLGLRRGEALGLQWPNVDFENKIIHIRYNYVMVDGKPVLREKTKTDSSNRSIIVTERIIKILKDHKHKQKIARIRLGKKYFKSDFVCTWGDGQPFNPSHLSRSFKLRMEKYGLPAIRFHDLRHSNASLMIDKGAPLKGASERLGHSTVQITQDLYVHPERSVQEQIAETIDKAIWGE